ncbi:MAG TPA: EI24 domain-containing protein [Desulfopila sp.]|nr:EI24 domain-containing protein [Desulfopila sp.]
MQTPGFEKKISRASGGYIPLSHSLAFLFSTKRLIGLSALLFVVTIALTWLGMDLSLAFIDRLTGGFFLTPPETASILGWLKYSGWTLLTWLYFFVSRIAAFYLAFLLAFTVSTPGYVFLATAAEKIQAGDQFEMDDGLTLRGILIDLWEGLKIACFGILISIAALIVNFIPLVGQLVALLLYIYFSALMFLDYPASRRRWPLRKKMAWVREHRGHSFRLGLFPALVSMIPIVNIFLMALLFPVLTVHATLNFTSLELAGRLPAAGERHGP